MGKRGNATRCSVKFVWSPEGRTVDVVESSDVESAKQVFYRKHPQYRKAKGEVGIEVEWRRSGTTEHGCEDV